MSSSSNEPTLEQRIAMAKAVYENNPTFKGNKPEAVMAPLDIKSLDLATVTKAEESKAVTALVTNIQNQKEMRLLRTKIEKQLRPKENTRIPKEINGDTIKMLPNVVKSKIESGVNRAEFLLECIEWEKEQVKKNEKPAPITFDSIEAMASIINKDAELLFGEREQDNYFWSETALAVLKGWIGVSERDKTEIKQLFEMCLVLFKSKTIHSEQKLDIASAFYLANLVEYWGSLYHEILNCPYTRIEDRMECCKLLYYSGDEKYLPDIEKHLTDVIMSDLDDDTRYQTIANYVTATGLSAKFLTNVLQLDEINQSLLTNLFMKFITTPCDFYYIIMSCEFLLEQEVNPNVYDDVCKKLLAIANDKGQDERTRADAADVLIRKNREPFSTDAQRVIEEIGEAGQTEIEKTIYSNKENVHKLNETFSKYIMMLHKKYIGKMQKFDDIVNMIEDLCETAPEETLFKIRQSIDRIMLEPTLHTERKISTSDIFRIIWTNCKDKEELQQRFLQELEDMANTCSSGHAKRLINVMVGFTDDLEGCIDIVDQFVANIKARLMATIRNMADTEKRDSLLESMTEKGAAKEPFNNHIRSTSESVKSELYSEFVTEGWLSEKRFDSIYNETLAKILK